MKEDLSPYLKEKEAYVHCVDLSAWEKKRSLLWNFLCDEEKKQAHRFPSEILRDRYIISHGILRVLLGYYLNLSPLALEFLFNGYGKPFLKDHPNIQFNMSHSHGISCYAFSLFHPIGIDIEWYNESLDVDSLVNLVLAPEEQEFFSKLNDEQKKMSTFYEIWTRKEALIKAVGIGLSYPIQTIDVIHRPPNGGVYLTDGEGNKKEWYLYSVKCKSDYYCALATDHELFEVTCKHVVA